MGGLIILVSITVLILLSIVLQNTHFFGTSFNNSLWNRKETYLAIATLFSVATIGAIDDYLNVRGIGRTKGLSAKVKMILLTILAILSAYWFTYRL